MTNTRDLQKAIDDFDNTPEGRGYDLRLDMAEIILRHLRSNGWTQNHLADVVKMKAPQITKLVQAGSNCTFETAGRILFAFGIKAQLIEVGFAMEARPSLVTECNTPTLIMFAPTGTTDEKGYKKISYETGGFNSSGRYYNGGQFTAAS